MKHLFILGNKFDPEDQGEEGGKPKRGREEQKHQNRLQLQEENQIHNDIVYLEDFEEKYSNLTWKTFLSLSHVHSHFRFDFVFKTDDDSFLRPLIFETRILQLKTEYPNGSVYVGSLMLQQPVLKEPNHPNSDFDFHDGPNFHPYMSGSGYLLSSDLVSHIMSITLPLRFLVNEDTAVGLWVLATNHHRVDDDAVLLPLKENEACLYLNSSSQWGRKSVQVEGEGFWVPVWYLMHYVDVEAFEECNKKLITSGVDEKICQNLSQIFSN